MKKNVKFYKCLIVITVLVVLTCFSSLHNYISTVYGSTNQSTQKIFLEEHFGNVSLSEHPITTSEFSTLKGNVGVYEQGKNYNQIVNGHGTGFQPPTAEEWNAISENIYVVDNVSYSSSPSAVDNSKSQYFPPIGNQGGQGSCVAWSVGYYITTFQAAKEHGWNLTGATWGGSQPAVSYQNRIISPAFVYNLINNGQDSGSTWYDAIQLVCFIGASSWMNMPYNQNDYISWPTQAAWTEAPLYRGSSNGYQFLSLSDDTGINNLKNWLASGNLATIDVDGNKFTNLSSNDVWTLDNYNSLSPNHAGTVVGYDDNFSYVESGQVKYGAFKIANSWGVGSWEHVSDGFYWISYAAMEQRVQSCYYYFDQNNYQPNLLATFNINDSARSNCLITIGLGNPSNPITTKSFSNYVFGGNKPFCTNNIVMDVSEFSSYVPSLYNQTFFLEVYDTQGTQTNGTIVYFAIGNSTALGTPCPTVKNQNVFLNVTYNPQYQLTLSTNYGTVSPASGMFNGGTIFNIAATPPASGSGERYVFLGWTGTGVGSYTGLDNPASITMNSYITETASWTKQYYLTVSSAYGTPGGSGWYDSGTSAYASTTLTVAGAGTQHIFTYWSGDASGTTTASYAITMNAPKIAIANWQTQYNLTIAQSGVGSDFSGSIITVNGTSYNIAGFTTWANSSDVFSFSYAPQLVIAANSKQYLLTGVSGNITASSLTVSQATTITGAYKTQYYLTTTSTHGSPSPLSGWLDNGSSITEFVGTPISSGSGSQYSCSGWSGSGSVPISGNASTVTFTVSAPSTITWNWSTQYYLTINSAYGVPSGGGWYNAGSTAYPTLSSGIIPNGTGSQYVFVSWNIDGTNYTQGTGIIMNSPETVAASWMTQYYLTVNNGGFGATSGSGWYNSDSSSQVTVLSNIMSGGSGTQYVFSGWTGDASGSDSTSNSITMNSPKIASASWTTQYQLTFVVIPLVGGSTTPTGNNMWVVSGPLSISVAPNSGYTFSGWTADSGFITFDNYNSMSSTANINGPGTIMASLTQNPTSTLSPTPTPTPTLTPTPTPTLTPTPTPSPTVTTTPTLPSTTAPPQAPSSVPEFPTWIAIALVIGVALLFVALKKKTRTAKVEQ